MVISVDNKKSEVLQKLIKNQLKLKWCVLFSEITSAVDLSHHHQQYLPPESPMPDDVSDISPCMEEGRQEDATENDTLPTRSSTRNRISPCSYLNESSMAKNPVSL